MRIWLLITLVGCCRCHPRQAARPYRTPLTHNVIPSFPDRPKVTPRGYLTDIRAKRDGVAARACTPRGTCEGIGASERHRWRPRGSGAGADRPRLRERKGMAMTTSFLRIPPLIILVSALVG